MMVGKGTLNILKGLKGNKEVLTTATTTVISNSSTLNFKSNNLSLRSKSTGGSFKNEVEIYALLKDVGEVRLCYGEKSTLIMWAILKCNFKEVLPSLLKINDGYLDNNHIYHLDDFRLVKSQKATEMFHLRFKNGVANPTEVNWWDDFNQLCVDLKFLTACEKEWATLSHEQKQILGSVYLGKNLNGKNLRLMDFMTHHISSIRRNLKIVLKDVCKQAPFDKQYLLDNLWCYSEYVILLEKNNITLKVRKGTLDYKFFTKFLLHFLLCYIIGRVLRYIF